MHHPLKRFAFCLLLVLVALACKRSDIGTEYIGPVDTTTPQNFSVAGDSIRARYNLVNFKNQVQSVYARFSHPVSWMLTIKGKTSGGIRRLSGTSAYLDSSNTGFDGKADSIFFFRAGEDCEVRLKIAGWAREYTTVFSINATPVFEGVVVDDFENTNDSTGFCVLYSDDSDSLVQFKPGQTEESFEGNQSMSISGFDTDRNYWISTLATKNLDFNALLNGKTGAETYLNLFAKGESDGRTQLEIQIQEDVNGDGVYSSSVDAQWAGKAALTGNWRQISLNMNDFERQGNNGSSSLNPAGILKITLVLVAYPSGGFAESTVDYVNFSFGAPFRQR